MSEQTVDLLNALLKILNWDQRKIDNVTALINSLGSLGDKEPIASSLNQDNSTISSSSVSESDLNGSSKQIETYNQQKEKLESDLRKRIVQLEAENKKLESDLSNKNEQLEASNQQKDKLESVLRKRIDQLEIENEKLKSDLSNKNVQLEAANHRLQYQNNLITKLAGEKDFLAKEKQKQDKRLEAISDFSRIEEINNFVNGLPISLKNLSCLRILAFDELPVLLTQFGNLQRLKSLWQAVHSEILATNQICDVELIRLLRIMIEYYNRANPGTELSVYEPHIGDKFDANLFSRLAGPFVPSCVSKVLFPGLKNVKGEHWVKPIVC